MEPLYIWTPHPTSPKWLVLAGHRDTNVRIEPMVDGYLWNCRKRYGYGKTLAEAKQWAETLADHYSIPPRQRWMSL